MGQRAIRDEALDLPASERLQLVEDLWESLAASPENIPVLDWHREILDERLGDEAEKATRSWAEVQENARRFRR